MKIHIIIRLPKYNTYIKHTEEISNKARAKNALFEGATLDRLVYLEKDKIMSVLFLIKGTG